jgi:hypothetical protein
MKTILIATATVVILVIVIKMLSTKNCQCNPPEICVDGKCVVDQDCQGTWGQWSECSLPCGGGTQTQNFNITTQPAGQGKACPEQKSRSRQCNTETCQSCQVGPWSDWSPCTQYCGEGVKKRTRSVTQKQLGDGYTCPFLVDTQMCNPEPCPESCVLSDWSDWSQCSTPCATTKISIVNGITKTIPSPGIKSRSRTIISPPVGNDPKTGQPYTCDTLYEEIDCTSDECPPCPESCNLSEWSDWSSCIRKTASGDVVVTCGGGVQTRQRTVVNGGNETCPLSTETRPCNTEECPVDCILSDWSNMSECDQPCGGGQSIQTRTILQFPNSTGKTCSEVAGDGLGLIKTIQCNEHTCDGTEPRLSMWSEWSKCKLGCGNTEEQTRTRTIIDANTYKGTYNVTTQTKPCENTAPCPVDCVVSDWLYPSECSTQCGPGTRFRWREVTQEPNSTGAPCPVLFKEEPCPECAYNSDGTLVDPSCTSNKHCSINCVTDIEWSDDKDKTCTNTCDTNGIPETKTQHKNILIHPQYGGEACGETTRTVNCVSKPLCPVHCAGKWSSFGECSKKCGGGTQTSQFFITTQPNATGVY